MKKSYKNIFLGIKYFNYLPEPTTQADIMRLKIQYNLTYKDIASLVFKSPDYIKDIFTAKRNKNNKMVRIVKNAIYKKFMG